MVVLMVMFSITCSGAAVCADAAVVVDVVVGVVVGINDAVVVVVGVVAGGVADDIMCDNGVGAVVGCVVTAYGVEDGDDVPVIVVRMMLVVVVVVGCKCVGVMNKIKRGFGYTILYR